MTRPDLHHQTRSKYSVHNIKPKNPNRNAQRPPVGIELQVSFSCSHGERLIIFFPAFDFLSFSRQPNSSNDCSNFFKFFLPQADVETDVAAGQPKKRTFKKFSFRGVDLDALLDMSTDELVKLFSARARRR